MLKNLYVLVCDDHVVLLEGLKTCLLRLPNVSKVEICTSIKEAIDMLNSEPRINFCITDLDFPDSSGMDLIDHIHKHSLSIKTLIYTSHEEIWQINAMIRSAADGLVFKSCNTDELKEAISCLQNGETYFCKRFQQLAKHIQMHIPESSNHLTSQEMNVLKLLAQGKRANDIAKELYVSVNTVNTHKSHLLAKMNAANTTELIIKAFVKGIVDLNLNH